MKKKPKGPEDRHAYYLGVFKLYHERHIFSYDSWNDLANEIEHDKKLSDNERDDLINTLFEHIYGTPIAPKVQSKKGRR